MKILFGVFDWGLGHATRDIPLIEEFLKRKDKVEIISTGRALKILKNRFGKKCTYYDVPSLHFLYGTNYNFKLSFVLAIPKLISSLGGARKLSKKIIEKGKYDKVISDCRYDVYDKIENSYLINHQLRFRAPPGVELIIEKWLANAMDNYKYILVPDYKEDSLSGKLSHELHLVDKKRIKYIGIISNAHKLNVKNNIDYLISLSGPENSRKEVHKKIMDQINHLTGSVVIAGGNPDVESHKIGERIKSYSFVDPKKQQELMNRAKFIIARGGYTTIMELVELDKTQVLLIPSPGQTEQEYLAEHLKRKGHFYSVDQDKVNLKKDIETSKSYKGYKAKWKTRESIRKFMEAIGA